MVRGVIFDMDGVLFDTERLGLVGWKLAGEQLGIPIDDAFISRLRGRNISDSRALYQKTFGRPDYDMARSIRVRYADDRIQREGLPVKPGLAPLLNELRERKLPVALATGSPCAKAEEYLKMAGIAAAFSALVCGDEMLHAKPAPDIFLAAAEALGLSPEQCMVLEDSPNGLRAAHAAGCIPVMIPDLTPSTPELARLYDACVPVLDKVIPLLDTL